MNGIKLFDAEYKFMNILWEHSSISSTQLVKYANKELGWKKSTTYTVIRRLSQRGVLRNDNAVVYALITRDQVMYLETEELINKVYDGSLKLFFTTFLQKEKLSSDEIEELNKIVENYRKENKND